MIIQANWKPSKHSQCPSNRGALDYEAYIEHQGKEYFGAGAINRLCRDLIKAYDNVQLVQLVKDGRVIGSVSNPLKTSLRSTRECKERGFNTYNYQPFNKEVLK